MRRILSTVAVVLVCHALFAAIASAGSLYDIEFIMIAANDAKATTKNPDGSLQIIQPGDVIADTFTVRKIEPGRITLENGSSEGPKGVIVRLEYGRQWLELLKGAPAEGSQPPPDPVQP